MGISNDHFRKLLTAANIRKVVGNYSLELDFSALGLKFDMAQAALDAQVWQDVQQYMPFENGTMRSETNVINVSTRGEVFMYPPGLEYGHYQYEGVVYEDPVLHTAGFLTEDGWKSCRGVAKVKTDRKLQYHRNDKAQSHWGEVAMANHEEAWLNLVKRALS